MPLYLKLLLLGFSITSAKHIFNWYSLQDLIKNSLSLTNSPVDLSLCPIPLHWWKQLMSYDELADWLAGWLAALSLVLWKTLGWASAFSALCTLTLHTVGLQDTSGTSPYHLCYYQKPVVSKKPVDSLWPKYHFWPQVVSTASPVWRMRSQLSDITLQVPSSSALVIFLSV